MINFAVGYPNKNLFNVGKPFVEIKAMPICTKKLLSAMIKINVYQDKRRESNNLFYGRIWLTGFFFHRNFWNRHSFLLPLQGI